MFPRITGISLQTAIMLAILAIGVAATVPEHGIAAAILRKDAGGLLLRRALPLLLIVVIVMSWLLLQARLSTNPRAIRARLANSPGAHANIRATETP